MKRLSENRFTDLITVRIQKGQINLAHSPSDNFQIDDPTLATPKRIANLSDAQTRKLRRLLQEKVASSFHLKKLPPHLLWRMSIVSVRENFGTKTTLKEFILACLKAIPAETTRTINIEKLEDELGDLRLTAKSFADPRRNRL